MTIFKFDSVTEALPHLLDHVQAAGDEVGSRQGDRTLEILMPQITLVKPWRREVLTPGRRASLPAQIAETMWVLAGRNDIEFLGHYLPRAKDFSDDGQTWRAGYGPRIRNWFTNVYDPGVDQLVHVVDLLKTDRTTRRAVINIYDPRVDIQAGKDIPCNNWLSFINRNGELHLNVAVRSNDVFWGWSGINTFEWSALQEIVAHLVGVRVGTLTFNVTSFHLYDRHWKRADEIVKTWRHTAGLDWTHPADSPRFDLGPVKDVETLDALIGEWFDVEDAIRNNRTGWAMSVNDFQEPMLKSWLHVIAAHWTGDPSWLALYKGTRLDQGYRFSPKRKVAQAVEGTVSIDISIDASKMVRSIEEAKANADAIFAKGAAEMRTLVSTALQVEPLKYKTEFVKYVDELHREKGKVYGDSWKKRGEQMSIMSNLGRKIDRLGVEGAGDTAADTLIDLLVYAIKYEQWIQEQWRGIDKRTHPSFHTDEFEHVRHTLNDLVRKTPMHTSDQDVADRIDTVKELFESLEKVVTTMPLGNDTVPLKERLGLVIDIEGVLFPAARHLWEQEQKPVEVEHPYVNSAATLTHRQETQRDVDAVKRIDEKTKKANETRFFAGYEEK